ARGWPESGTPVGSAMNYMPPPAGNARGGPGDFNTVVTPDGFEGVIVAWQEREYPAASHPLPGIHAQRVARDGRLLWGARGVVVSQGPRRRFPAVAADGTGGVFIVCQDERADSLMHRIYGQRLSPRGAERWRASGQPMTRGSDQNEQYPVLAVHGDRGVVVAWQAGMAADAVELRAQRASESGRLLWSADVSISGRPHALSNLTAMQNPKTGFWFAWLDDRVPGTTAVFAQRLTLNGAVSRGWRPDGNPVCATPPLARSNPHLVGDGRDGAYLTWFDEHSPRATRMTSRAAIAEEWRGGRTALSTSPFGGSQMALIPS